MNRPDTLSRTAKMFLDDGTAKTIDDANAILAEYVLQIDVAIGIEKSPTRQAMLLTIINTAARAFLGGVRVRTADNPLLSSGWAERMPLAAAVERFGGTLVDMFADKYATVVIGATEEMPIGAVTLIPTWQGWAGGVVTDAAARLGEALEFELAGVLAGGLAVSEAFQFQRGYPSAGRRAVGISLWRPDLDWRAAAAAGPSCRYLPAGAWIAGLGHLGQAYCWALGCLPYADPNQLALMLQDFDFITEANESTSLLAEAACTGKRKTRVVAEGLERLGFVTAITERRFDACMKRVGDEPVLALAGFDKPEPRRDLDPAVRDFNLVVDGGLGRGPQHYLDILVHSFPASLATTEAFPVAAAVAEPDVDQPAYQHLEEELVGEGASRGEARCGVIEIAGRTVAAAFVGAVTATLVLAEPLRVLHGGRRYEVVAVSLRTPEYVDAAECSEGTLPPLPFTPAKLT